jgi:hypothetical protein
MPGFDTLGARLARSRRRLERERAAVNIERLAQHAPEIAAQGEGVPDASASMPMLASAQVIRFPGPNERPRD